MTNYQAFLSNEQQTEAFGLALAQSISAPITLYLQGELGAGKTTLVRGLLRGLGHQGSTKSPTYTLVEPYELKTELKNIAVYHFDLYRLADPEELEYIGIREYQSRNAILIFEWPDKGEDMIPAADLLIELEYKNEGREIVLKDFAGKLANNWNFDEFLCQNGN